MSRHRAIDEASDDAAGAQSPAASRSTGSRHAQPATTGRRPHEAEQLSLL
jgi:hypothetical protein